MLVSQSKRKRLYSFVPWPSTTGILNLMVQNQRLLVQKVLPGS